MSYYKRNDQLESTDRRARKMAAKGKIIIALCVLIGVAAVSYFPEQKRTTAQVPVLDEKIARAAVINADNRSVEATAPLANKPQQPDPFETAIDAIKRGDEDAALKILLPLAAQGNAQAQFSVGEIYLLFKNQDADALKWFRQAADQGDASGMYFLGNMYNNGSGVRKNLVEAHKWYILAASQAGPRKKGEMDTLNMAIENRNGVSRRMTSAQIAEAQKLARDWSVAHKLAAPNPKREVASNEPPSQEKCSTSGQFKTCTVAETFGTRTTVTNLLATERVGGKLQNIHSVRIAFDDVKKDESAPLAMIGMFMMLVLPSSTQAQRADLLEQMFKRANTSSVRAYGWNWSINSSGTPAKGVIFAATKSS
jgi:hypothetical protein